MARRSAVRDQLSGRRAGKISAHIALACQCVAGRVSSLDVTHHYHIPRSNCSPARYEQLIKAGHPMSKIFAERLRRGVSRLPNPLEYFGYVFCFTTFFAGPAFEYGEYVRSVAEAPFITGDGKKDRQWGSRVWAAVSKLVMGIAFLGLTVYGQANFPFTSITTEAMMYGPGEYGWCRL